MKRTALALTLLLVGCSRSAEPAPVAPPTEAPAAAPVELLLTTVTALRKAPSDERRIQDPASPGKQLSNWVATLHRGERVRRRAACAQGWCKVEAAGGEGGFMKESALMEAGGVGLATVLEGAELFRRPDLVALDGARRLDPGTLLFVLRAQDGFTEVNYQGSASAWVQSEALVEAPKEVEVSRLLGQLRWMQTQNDSGAAELRALIQSQFGDTRLAGRLAL